MMKTRQIYLKTILAHLFFWFALALGAQNINIAAYYKQAEGKHDAELKTALHNIAMEGHRQQGYYAVSGFFENYDLTPDGYIWDMYSEPRCESWRGCGLNREHNMPKSWFGISSRYEDSDPIGCDYHNLYPSDEEANSKKSNFPLGETNGESYSNGVSKVGKSTFSGYSNTVFEPADKYKGDFARCYMYMVTRYEDYSARWVNTGSSMLNNNTYPTLNSYAVNLLMRWHRDDPVSQKEIDRNNSVDKVQGNRNPFVDYPEFAEFIWGNMKSEVWYPNATYSDFSVCPNPARDFITVNLTRNEGAIIHYEIYSISGIRMISGELNSDGAVEIKGLTGGLYILTVYPNNRRLTTRFAVGSSLAKD